MSREQGDERETPFALAPRSVRRALQCGDCVRLFWLLDEVQGDRGRPVRGVNAIAEELAWQIRTAKKHARHLEEVGLVALEPSPAKGRTWGHVRFRVVHNPARSRYAHSLKAVPGVWDPDPPVRWRPPSNIDDVTNAERAAPSVGPAEPMRRNAPSVGPQVAESQGAPRIETERAAPPGSGAPRIETERAAPSVGRYLSRRSGRSDEPERPLAELQRRNEGSGSCATRSEGLIDQDPTRPFKSEVEMLHRQQSFERSSLEWCRRANWWSAAGPRAGVYRIQELQGTWVTTWQAPPDDPRYVLLESDDLASAISAAEMHASNFPAIEPEATR